jgi:Ca2+-binding RTX toxin-like protein
MARYSTQHVINETKSKIVIAISTLGLVLGGGTFSMAIMASTAGAAPEQPTQCDQTYTNTNTITVSGNDKAVNGTSGKDLIFVQGNDNSVTSKDGKDCIVVTGSDNYIDAGADNDVIVNSGNSNYLAGGGGNDKIYDSGTNNYLNGGAGNDTCVYDNSVSAAKSCEQ